MDFTVPPPGFNASVPPPGLPPPSSAPPAAPAAPGGDSAEFNPSDPFHEYSEGDMMGGFEPTAANQWSVPPPGGNTCL